MLTLLTSTVGISVYRHICGTSGIVETGIGDKDHCCGSMEEMHQDYSCINPSDIAEIQPSCCEFQVTHHRILVETPVQASLDIQPVLSQSEFPLNLFLTSCSIANLENDLQDHSPPIQRDILAMQSILII